MATEMPTADMPTVKKYQVRFVSRSLSDSGSVVTLDMTSTSGQDMGLTYISLNLTAGDTITIATTSPSILFRLSDYTGATVEEDFSGASSSIVTSAVPYTGRYILAVGAFDPSSDTTWQITVTPSSTYSLNPIQALYDGGLTCPARLDCT